VAVHEKEKADSRERVENGSRREAPDVTHAPPKRRGLFYPTRFVAKYFHAIRTRVDL